MEHTDSTDYKNDDIESVSWNWRRNPQTLIFSYKPFILECAVAQWMPQNQGAGLAKPYADWNLESFKYKEVLLVSSVAHQIFYWFDKLFTLNWCCVLCVDKPQGSSQGCWVSHAASWNKM